MKRVDLDTKYYKSVVAIEYTLVPHEDVKAMIHELRLLRKLRHYTSDAECVYCFAIVPFQHRVDCPVKALEEME